MSENKKLTILSWTFAPQVVGSPILLHNLFENYKGPLEAIAGWDISARVDSNFKPCCKTTYFKPPNFSVNRIQIRDWHPLLPSSLAEQGPSQSESHRQKP